MASGTGTNGAQPSFSTTKPLVRRLTGREYRNTLSDLLPSVTIPPVALVADASYLSFDNMALVQTASTALIGNYDDAAFAVAKLAVASPKAGELLGCNPLAPGDETSCVTGVINTFAKRAFRRPVGDDEAASLTALFRETRTKSRRGSRIF